MEAVMAEINWELVERMSTDEVENLRVEVIKEIQELEESAQVVREVYDNKVKQMIQLEGEKKDLSMSLSKQRFNIKKKKTDLDILTTKFWQKRR
jgi:hypothetical protein